MIVPIPMRKIVLWLMVLGVLLPTSCGRDKTRLRKTLARFETVQVIVPEDMLMIQEGKQRPYQLPDSIPILVMYVSPEECSGCRINHIMDNEDLYRWGEESGQFKLMIVISPRPEMMERTQEELTKSKFSIPVYLDVYSEFHDRNDVPADTRVHCFLLDGNRYPIFVGNPSASEQLNGLFKKVLDLMD